MCVIIHKPAGKIIPAKDLKQAWASNSDGAGIVIPSRCPKVFKGIMKLKHLENIIETLTDHEIVIHLRWATHGSVSPDNTHPFPCGRDRYLMHNGILSNYGEAGKKGRSDSAHFAEDISTLKAENIKRILETVSGKFIFINRERISLHGQFSDRNGIKYSNLNWAPTKEYYFERTRSKDWVTEYRNGYNISTSAKDTKLNDNDKPVLKLAVSTDPFHVSPNGVISGSEVADPLAD